MAATLLHNPAQPIPEDRRRGVRIALYGDRVWLTQFIPNWNDIPECMRKYTLNTLRNVPEPCTSILTATGDRHWCVPTSLVCMPMILLPDGTCYSCLRSEHTNVGYLEVMDT